MSSNDHGTNNADFALDIENIGNDAQIGRDNNNVRGTNHDKVSQILSGWMPRRKTGNNAARSTGENGDGVLSAWGEEEQRSSLPQQKNVPKNEPRSNWKKAFHLPRLKSGSKGGHDEPEADEGPDDEEENRTFVGDKIEDLDEQVKEWKKLLKSVSNDKTEEHVRRKVDEFLTSQEIKKLK